MVDNVLCYLFYRCYFWFLFMGCLFWWWIFCFFWVIVGWGVVMVGGCWFRCVGWWGCVWDGWGWLWWSLGYWCWVGWIMLGWFCNVGRSSVCSWLMRYILLVCLLVSGMLCVVLWFRWWWCCLWCVGRLSSGSEWYCLVVWWWCSVDSCNGNCWYGFWVWWIFFVGVLV